MSHYGHQISRQSQGDERVKIFRNQFGHLTLDQSEAVEQVTQFRDQTEMLAAMDLKHPSTGEDLYSKSPAYRRGFDGIMANTSASSVGVDLEPRQAIPTDEEMLKGMMEDAARQRFAQLVDKAGGNDAIAKLELARAMINPTEAQHNEFSLIQTQTDLASTRPMEQYLKSRKEQGLGPQVDYIQVWDDHNEDYEQKKTQEALDFLTQEEDIALREYES